MMELSDAARISTIRLAVLTQYGIMKDRLADRWTLCDSIELRE